MIRIFSWLIYGESHTGDPCLYLRLEVEMSKETPEALSETELKELKEKAEKAARLPMAFDSENFIAAANPSTVLRLISMVEQLQTENQNLRHGLDEEGLSLSERCCGSVKGQLNDQVQSLQHQLEEARLTTPEAEKIRAAALEEAAKAAEGLLLATAIYNLPEPKWNEAIKRIALAIRSIAEEGSKVDE